MLTTLNTDAILQRIEFKTGLKIYASYITAAFFLY